MAYGTDETTLDSFDNVIPDEVFKEVTSISLEEFCFLRDGAPILMRRLEKQSNLSDIFLMK